MPVKPAPTTQISARSGPRSAGREILPVRRGGIIGGDMAAFRHARPPASSATPSNAQTSVMVITSSRMR